MMIPEDLLTLIDVALLLDGEDVPPASTRRLSEFLRSDRRLQARVAELEALARDAGVEKLTDGVMHHQDFDRLLAAPGWRHPAEVLDPYGDIGISYPALLSVARAREGRAEDPAPIQEVRTRLEQARTEADVSLGLVSRIVEPLLDEDPDDAKWLLTQALAEYRCRRRGAEARAGEPAGRAEE